MSQSGDIKFKVQEHDNEFEGVYRVHARDIVNESQGQKKLELDIQENLFDIIHTNNNDEFSITFAKSGSISDFINENDVCLKGYVYKIEENLYYISFGGLLCKINWKPDILKLYENKQILNSKIYLLMNI